MSEIAIIAIDLHRGHLDPDAATMPLSPAESERVVEANRKFFDACRAKGIPIIHLLTQYRDAQEILSNPAWQYRADDPSATRKNVARHNLAGMPGVQVMPTLWEPQDILVDTKKRYDCFVATDLEFILRANGIKTLYVTGVNTNSCVLATSIYASTRDFDVTIVSDCVDTMDGPAFHDAALMVFERAFGKVKASDEIMNQLDVLVTT